MSNKAHEVRDDTIPEGARKPLPKWMIASIVSAAVVAGLGLFFAIAWPWLYLMFASSSAEDRYQNTNQLLEDIGYRDVGTVLYEKWDGEDAPQSSSPMNRAYFEATLEGEEVYEILSERIVEAAPGGKCVASDTSLYCTRGNPSVQLTLMQDGTTLLTTSEV